MQLITLHGVSTCILKACVQFQWDETKNTVNIRKHKIDFCDVPAVFKGAMLIDYDDVHAYGEDRWIGWVCFMV